MRESRDRPYYVISRERTNKDENTTSRTWSKASAASLSSSSFPRTNTHTHLYRCVRCVCFVHLFVPYFTTILIVPTLPSIPSYPASIRVLAVDLLYCRSYPSYSCLYFALPEQIEHIDRGVSVFSRMSSCFPTGFICQGSS